MKKLLKKNHGELEATSKKTASLFRSLSQSRQAPETLISQLPPEQALMVYVPVSEDFESDEELDEIEDLCDELEGAIENSGSGEFDGYEYGEGECVLFMYGPSADHLYESIEFILKQDPLCRGGYVIKRYGSEDDPYAKEEKVYL